MLPSTCPREALVACPPCPPSNLPSFTVEFILSSPCSRSDPLHSRQGAALAHLDSLPPHDLVLWTDGSVPFPFGKGGSGVLANCSLCGTEATLSFSAGPVCSSFSSYLKLCGRSGRTCLVSPPVLSGYNGSPDTRFSRGTTRLTSLPDEELYLSPPQSLVVSLLLSLVSTLVFSRTGGVLSLRSIVTHRFPRFPLRSLCSLVMLAVSSLVFAATDTAFFYDLICVGLAELRTLLAAPVDTVPGHLSSHSALSSDGLFAQLTLW